MIDRRFKTPGKSRNMTTNNENSLGSPTQRQRTNAENRNLQLHRRVAFSLFQSRRLTELEPVCRLILAIDQGDVDAIYLLGLSLKAQGKGEEAGPYFWEAAHAAPDNTTVLATTANELLNLEQFEASISLYEKLLVLQPGSVSVYNNVGYCYYGLGKIKDAIRYYRKALRISPDDASTLNNLGIVFLELGRKQVAKSLFDKAIEIQPGFHQAHYHRHAAVFRDDAPAEAIAALRAALDAGPQNILAKAYLAMLLDLSGQGKEASSLFSEIEAKQLSFLIDSWEYVKSHRTPDTRLFSITFDSLRHAFAGTMDEGLVLEFGVRRGNTIGLISRQTKDPVHGFDSFEGLPEDWEGVQKGLYTTGSELPRVNSNVSLHKGWFEDTLPGFCRQNQGGIRFMNVDCDIYSSTRTIFEHLGNRLKPGSVVVFDEYICNPHWRDDEYKAFQEFVTEHNIRYEYLLFSPFTKQAAVIIK